MRETNKTKPRSVEINAKNGNRT